jgi:hypothetical protein
MHTRRRVDRNVPPSSTQRSYALGCVGVSEFVDVCVSVCMGSQYLRFVSGYEWATAKRGNRV